jgi:hypothetical protein
MRRKLIVLGATLAALGGAVALERARSDERGAQAAPTKTTAPPEAEPAATPHAPLPVHPPASEGPRVDAEERAPGPSFESLVAEVSGFTDEQIAAELEELKRDIERGDWVSRANRGELDEQGREAFRLLVRRQNALHAARVQRLLDEADSEGI